ncbi:MAG: right-handed parallel beta-helix repeat-containing protein [Verrucomicrobiaceae bacterium]|nr:right-handed parallel beta-helix repeat-containing protein [Verrucomicrobiaceae bacterium]
MRTLITSAIALLVISHSSFVIAQGGPLTPPGAPAPTMRSLQEIYDKAAAVETQGAITQTNVGAVQTSVNGIQDDPRTPISSLPFTISASGSYYVTGNLTGTAAANGIGVNASNVTIDLGGFELVGVAGGTVNGVNINSSRTNVTIRNGTVRGWTGSGIAAITNAEIRVEDVRAISNSSAGISVGNQSTVSRCVVRGNGGNGISGGAHCVVLGCVAIGQTAGTGIILGQSGVVSDCTAAENSGNGISVSTGSVVSRCAARLNTGTGISTSIGSTVQGCAATSNGGIGIDVSSGSTVSDCSSDSNSGTSGIAAGIACSLTRCTVRNSTSAATISQGISVVAGGCVSECVVTGSTSTAAAFTATTGMGIAVGSDSTVERCTVSSSKGDGIRASASCRIVGNFVTGSGAGVGTDGAGVHTTSTFNLIDGNKVRSAVRGLDVDATASIIVRNTVAATTNYVIAANNSVGPIVVPGNNAAINGNVAVASSLGTTDPWANLSE